MATRSTQSQTPQSLAAQSLAGQAIAERASTERAKRRRPRKRRDNGLTEAQRHTILAIELNGGEVCEMRHGARSRWVAMDGYGGEIEQYDARTIRALTGRGDLTVKRFAFGGAIYGLACSDARAAAFNGAKARMDGGAERTSVRKQAATAAARGRPSFAPGAAKS